MTGPPTSIAAVRLAVREALTHHGLAGATVLVACSGGADSLALALAAGFEVPRLGGRAGAVIVDHQLQPGSGEIAMTARRDCAALGLAPVQIVTVDVRAQTSGLEDAARRARLDAFAQVADQQAARAVLVGHTRDDQAEQVLLGLVRGSGARSLSGMPRARPLRPSQERGGGLTLLRPLLQVPRDVTERACAAAGLTAWQDPHNADQCFTRVRARAALVDLHERLGPGVGAALARSADLLRADAEALDELSDTAYSRLGPPPWPVEQLREHPGAIRTRLWLRMAVCAGSPAGSLAASHLQAIDALYTNWHGQGPIDVPGEIRIHRAGGLIWPQSHQGARAQLR
ncbi:MAG: tRNA lysidine(34) synthetase TilS [Ornithinimicrobium sp.]